MTDAPEILSRTEGGIGWITLNRPRALNALSLYMIRKISRLLKEWEEAPSLKAIVIEGAGEKSFCAGGDVRAVYEAKKEGHPQTCDDSHPAVIHERGVCPGCPAARQPDTTG